MVRWRTGRYSPLRGKRGGIMKVELGELFDCVSGYWIAQLLRKKEERVTMTWHSGAVKLKSSTLVFPLDSYSYITNSSVQLRHAE